MIDGYLRFLRKELAEIVRTWRLPVLAGIVLFFALTGPLTALFTPALLKSMQSSTPGVVIQLPEPIWRDAYAQWIKNLSQIVSFVVLITAAGSVAGEVSSGTALLVLTKPVSRKAFVLAKATALAALVGFVTVAGTALTQIETLVVFHKAPAAELWFPTLAWLLFALVLIAVMVVLSSIVSTLAAAGLGVAVFFALSLAALWGPLVRYTPVGLLVAPGKLLLGTHQALAAPVATSVVAVAALLVLAAALFQRREI